MSSEYQKCFCTASEEQNPILSDINFPNYLTFCIKRKKNINSQDSSHHCQVILSIIISVFSLRLSTLLFLTNKKKQYFWIFFFYFLN